MPHLPSPLPGSLLCRYVRAERGQRPHAGRSCIGGVQRQEPLRRRSQVSAPPPQHPGHPQSREGAAGAGRFWPACSELRDGRAEEGEALCPGAVLPVHQHQHPLTTGHPLSGQHLGEPLPQEDLFWPLRGGAGGPDQPLDPGQLVVGRRGVGPLPRGGRVLRRRVPQGAEQARCGSGGPRRRSAQTRAVTDKDGSDIRL